MITRSNCCQIPHTRDFLTKGGQFLRGSCPLVRVSGFYTRKGDQPPPENVSLSLEKNGSRSISITPALIPTPEVSHRQWNVVKYFKAAFRENRASLSDLTATRDFKDRLQYYVALGFFPSFGLFSAQRSIAFVLP
jgi:hypothetical protein